MVTSLYHTEEKQLYLHFKPRALTSIGDKQVILNTILSTWTNMIQRLEMSSNLNRNIAIVTKYIMAIANKMWSGNYWLLQTGTSELTINRKVNISTKTSTRFDKTERCYMIPRIQNIRLIWGPYFANQVVYKILVLQKFQA